jgi:hypothetical protein
MTLIEQLLEFIQEAERGDCWSFNRKWIEDDHMKVYVRLGRRYLPNRDIRYAHQDQYRTLELASIDVDEDRQNQGLFASFLAEVEKLNPCEALYVENVLTARFESFFIRNGFLPVPNSTPPSFYKWGATDESV